jgi:hypothetical protein
MGHLITIISQIAVHARMPVQFFLNYYQEKSALPTSDIFPPSSSELKGYDVKMRECDKHLSAFK